MGSRLERGLEIGRAAATNATPLLALTFWRTARQLLPLLPNNVPPLLLPCTSSAHPSPCSLPLCAPLPFLIQRVEGKRGGALAGRDGLPLSNPLTEASASVGWAGPDCILHRVKCFIPHSRTVILTWIRPLLVVNNNKWKKTCSASCLA